MIDGPRGRRALIQFDVEVDAYRASFELSYGVFTSVHEQFMADGAAAPRPWPYTSEALVSTRLLSPQLAQVGVPGHGFPWVGYSSVTTSTTPRWVPRW
jgi:hypothetical protein